MKKTWKKPRLTILTNNTPEEMVLSYCKTRGLGGSGPSEVFYDCENTPGYCLKCDNGGLS